MTGAQALVRSLAAEGVEVIFGLPGVHAMPIYDALYDHREIRYIGVRHEQAAAYMADGYARSTGRAGVCLTTTGPGAANTAAAMAEAYSSSSPVLQICTQIHSSLVDKGKGALHETKDQLGLFRAVTGWNKRIESVKDIPLSVHLAMTKMKNGRPRPVQLEIPVDLLTLEADIELPQPQDRQREAGDEALVQEAAELLRRSHTPVIWAGGGVITSQATTELLELAELLQAPVLTTFMGKGTISEEHPLSLGNWATVSDARDLLQELLNDSDLMLAVGTRFSAMSTGQWTLRFPERLIQIDIDPAEMGKNYPAEIAIVGDAKRILQDILVRLSEAGAGERASRADDAKGLRDTVHEIVAATQIGRLEVVEVIRAALSKDAILVNDMTMVSYTACRHFRVYQPRTLLYPTGFGSLGFGFPAALGAKIAWPQRQVVAICGDGGFMVSCQELATAVQHRINLPVLIFNDQGYGVLRQTQDIEYSGRRIGVDLLTPDFVKFAEAFGVEGLRVEQLEDLGPVLQNALRAQKPTLIEVAGPLIESFS